MKNLIQPIIILIAVLQSTTGTEEVIYAKMGQAVTLMPPQTSNIEDYYLYWFSEKEDGPKLAWRNTLQGKGIEKWGNVLSLSRDSLIIKNVTEEQFGTFVCKLTSSRRSPEKLMATYKLRRINVNVRPSSPVLSGETLYLTCSVESSQDHRNPEIYWLDPQGKKVNKEQARRITATRQHNGQWTCVLINGGKESKNKLSVEVIDLSPAPLHPLYTSKSSRLTIPCSIPAEITWEQIKAKGIKEVHWDFLPNADPGLTSGARQRLFSLTLNHSQTWKPDQARGLKPVEDPKKLNLSLIRNQGREDDSGQYVCTLKFREGVALTRTINVKVLRIISSPGTELISGQQVNLTCSFGERLLPGQQLKWFPPKETSLPSLAPDHATTHLTIPEVGTGDGGKWRCELWQNRTRLTSAMITLKIESKLSAWMLVIICSVTVIVILLIIVCILYRQRRRKMRHPRQRLCQCRNPKPKGFYKT